MAIEFKSKSARGNVPIKIPKKPPVEKISDLKKITQKISDGSRSSGKDPRFESDRKRRVTIWFDKEIIEHFKKDGPGWQSRLNEFLRAGLGIGGP